MQKPLYQEMSLTDIDNEIRTLFTGSSGDQKTLVYQTGRVPSTISQWLSEESERPSPIAMGLLLQCAIDRGFPEKGEAVWQITRRVRAEMKGRQNRSASESALIEEFQDKFNELIAASSKMSYEDRLRFLSTIHGLTHSALKKEIDERDLKIPEKRSTAFAE